MNATLERILSDVAQLPQREQCELTALLNDRFESELAGEDAEVSAAWEAEIHDRAASVISGKATLIPGEEFEAQMASFISDFKAGLNPATL
jgi:putative addiction module component (TIGR02574 family)